jgi:phosphate starvation-inducible PhoH-like protein
LAQAINLLSHINGIAKVELTAEDVVRHRLVKEIIKAYSKDQNKYRHEDEIEIVDTTEPAKPEDINGKSSL